MPPFIYLPQIQITIMAINVNFLLFIMKAPHIPWQPQLLWSAAAQQH